MSDRDERNELYNLAAMRTHARVLDNSLSDLRELVRQSRSLSESNQKFVNDQLTTASIALNNVAAELGIAVDKLL